MIDIKLKKGDIFEYHTGEYEDAYKVHLTCLKSFSTLDLYRTHIEEQFLKYDVMDDPNGSYFSQYIDLLAYMYINGYVESSVSTKLCIFEEEYPSLKELGLSEEDFINKAKKEK